MSSLDEVTARAVAAHVQLERRSPTGAELALRLGIREEAAMRRMQRAFRRGWLRKRYGGYWPVYRRLPEHLRHTVPHESRLLPL